MIDDAENTTPDNNTRPIRDTSPKRCSRCSEVKALTEFGKKKKFPDGLDCCCRKCHQQEREIRKQQILGNLQEHPEARPLAKTCRKCGLTKLLEEFSRCQYRSDGRLHRCRDCELQLRWQREGPPVTERFDDPDLKRCPRCLEVKSRRNDFHPRHQEGVSVLLVAGHCKQCSLAAKRDWWAATRDERRRRSREKYRKRAAFYAECQRRWREAHPEAAKATAQQFYRRWREKLLQKARQYREANRIRVNARIREWRVRHPDWPAQYRARNRDRIRHYARVKYWENPEKRRLQRRLYSESSPGRSGKSRLTPVSLNDTFGNKGTLSRLDRVADTRIVSPETAAVEAPSLQAVRAFVSEELTAEERLILEAFADCGFSAAGAAELLDLTLGEVEAAMSAIRSRAAALKED